MYALQGIGYTPGLKLFELDKLKLGSMIRRTVKDGPRGIIEDISDGELMIKRIGQSYRQTGAIQGENFFKILLEMKYDGGNPLDYVTNFRRAVRDVRSTKLELQDAIIIILFKLSVKGKAENWYQVVSQAARKITWTAEELYNDFISSNNIKRPTRQGQTQIRGSAHIAESSQGKGFQKNRFEFQTKFVKGQRTRTPNDTNTSQTADNKPKKSVQCWVCDQTGHYANQCPHKGYGVDRGKDDQKQIQFQ
ncbi:hypothetical protein GcM3_171016, partial [Golovinomyces cichoracearum]